MITLGIIGVVAAITIPVLMQNHQKQVTVTKLKKVYSTLNQAFRMSEAENGSYANWEDSDTLGGIVFFEKYWKPYLRYIKTCPNYSACGYAQRNPWKYLDGETYDGEVCYESGDTRRVIILPDGMLIEFITSYGFKTTTIMVDLNGYKKPNVFGKDAFRLLWGEKGVHFSAYENSTREEILASTPNGCAKSATGKSCGALIQLDGWQIADDYPW